MHLYLENFQSIRGPVRIDFAPITLFYGPNSAGKSAVYDAIRILSEMYENKWSDENMTPFMHQHNFDQKMTLGIGGIASFPGYYQPPMSKKKSAESDIGDFLFCNYSATRCSQPFSEKHQMLCFGKNHSGNFQKIVKQITPSQQSEKCNPLFYNVVSFSLIG